MSSAWFLQCIQGAQRAIQAPAWKRFLHATRRIAHTQSTLLLNTLHNHQHTALGRHLKLDKIKTVNDYQRLIPSHDYEQLRPWIARAASGEPNILTPDPILIFERTSGSTTQDKLIPYTAPLRAQFNAAISPWLFNILTHHPVLWGRRSYWSISPVARLASKTECGIPIGFQDDSEYFSPLERWAIRRAWAVQPTLSRAPSVDIWRHQTAIQLLAAQDLGFISVWSPTFLIELMRYIFQNIHALLHDLRAIDPRQSLAIRRRLDTNPLNGTTLWPALTLLSCWADGPSQHFIAPLQRQFPNIPIQPKGLIATEGVVTFPLCGTSAGAIPAITSHFLEFIDLNHPQRQPTLIQNLRPGATYSPLLTTAAGFFRYHLKDALLALPPHPKFPHVPLLQFVSRIDGGSDLCGEKLDPLSASQAISEAQKSLSFPPTFALLTPNRTPNPHYRLYLSDDINSDAAQHFAASVERALMRSYHYKYARDLGQLSEIQPIRVQNPWPAYQNRLVADGLRLGNIKFKSIDTREHWDQFFTSAP